jgi:RNA polymerase sigma-70 factor (ECF subfamily)
MPWRIFPGEDDRDVLSCCLGAAPEDLVGHSLGAELLSGPISDETRIPFFARKASGTMDAPSGPHTSPTLLGRLRQQPTDQAAWEEFVRRYGPQVHTWCRQARLQEADAEDVTQMVLVKLAEKMRTFAYDPTKTFRGWLRTLTRHAWSDFVEARQRGGRGRGNSQAGACLHTVPARDELVARLEEQFDLEVLEEAAARVRLRVDPGTWEVFRLCALEGMPVTDVAARLGKQVAAVFKARKRVQTALQEEIRKLEGGDP